MNSGQLHWPLQSVNPQPKCVSSAERGRQEEERENRKERVFSLFIWSLRFSHRHQWQWPRLHLPSLPESEMQRHRALWCTRRAEKMKAGKQRSSVTTHNFVLLHSHLEKTRIQHMSLVTYHTELVEGLDSMQSILEKLQRRYSYVVHNNGYMQHSRCVAQVNDLLCRGTFTQRVALQYSIHSTLHGWKYLNKETILEWRNILVSLKIQTNTLWFTNSCYNPKCAGQPSKP